MGNSLPDQQQQKIQKALENKKGKMYTASIQNTLRSGQDKKSTHQRSTIQLDKNGQKQSKHRSLNHNKSKQKLSLSKQHCSSNRCKPIRSASNDFKTSHIIHNIPTSPSQHHSLTNIHTNFVRFNARQAQPKIKKVALRPRDLPRKFSTEKVIIVEQLPIRRVPLEPRIIVGPPPASSPCIQINYIKKEKNRSEHSMESSIVTPFIPLAPPQEHAKALKKVALSKSYASNSFALPYQNNGEQYSINKENNNSCKDKIKSQTKIQGECKQQSLFTDPTLYSYITNKPHPFGSQIKNKYALPTDQPTTKHNTSLQVATPYKVYTCLEEAVSEEVQSKSMIESESYRFPTFTDVSQGTHTDNTSFMPMARNQSKNSQMQGEQLVRFCRPQIDERVLLDLQRLNLSK